MPSFVYNGAVPARVEGLVDDPDVHPGGYVFPGQVVDLDASPGGDFREVFPVDSVPEPEVAVDTNVAEPEPAPVETVPVEAVPVEAPTEEPFGHPVEEAPAS